MLTDASHILGFVNEFVFTWIGLGCPELNEIFRGDFIQGFLGVSVWR